MAVRYGSLAQLGEHLPYKQRVTGSSPVTPTKWPGSSVGQNASLSRQRSRVRAPSGSPFFLALQLSWQSGGLKILMSLVRFRPEPPLVCGFSSSGRASPCQGEGSEFEPRNPLHFFIYKRYHSQVVRQRSAKPLRPGSNPGGASKKSCTQVRDFYFLPLTSSLLPRMAGFFGK